MKSPLILIVTEDSVSGEDLGDRLARHAFNVTSLPVHSQALPFLHRKNPDLVIIGSKGGHSFEGMQLVKEIRSIDHKVPLILITEQSSEDLVVAALRSGVNDYFKVPFSFQDLLRSIESRVVRNDNIGPAIQGGQRMIVRAGRCGRLRSLSHGLQPRTARC